MSNDANAQAAAPAPAKAPAPRPTTMLVNAKCSDQCQIALYDQHGNTITEYHGHVPDGLGIDDGGFGGDYIQLEINLDTGQILNWKRPAVAALRRLLREREE